MIRTRATSTLAFTANDRNSLHWFWQNWLKERRWALAGLALLVISQGAMYQQFLALTDRSLRVIFENGSVHDLIWICAMVFTVFAYRGLLAFFVPRISALIATKAVLALRQDLIAQMISLDLNYFDRTPSGQLIQHLVRQCEILSDFIGQTSVRALRDIATVIIVSAYLCWQQPFLFAAATVVIPILVFSMQRVSRRIKTVQSASEQAQADYIAVIDEVVSGMRTVRITGQSDVEKNRLIRASADLRRLTVRILTARAMAAPFVDLAAAFVYMLVIGGGGYLALSPHYTMDGASIITFLLGLVLVFDPARRLAQFWAQLQSVLVVLHQLQGLYAQQPTITDAPDALQKFNPAGGLSLRNVRFGYHPDRPLFDGLDLECPGGKTTAIVGTTGSGKTTVLSLLTRLYDPQASTVMIGDVPINRIALAPLREAFCVVAQDIVIFNASIRDNIRYVRPDASEADIAAAAKAAEIADLMITRGEIPVGPKGALLSGGQRQRIGIARAFLRAAPIVFLDEATSALDQRTEEKIRHSLKRLAQGRTTIIVAHRLGAIIHADLIHVLEGGRLVESGTHDQLMAGQGAYHALFLAQQKNDQT